MSKQQPKQPIVKFLSYKQVPSESVYCIDGQEHITVTNPHSVHSGEPHKLTFTACDCEAASEGAPAE